MPTVTITWDDINDNEDGFNIYRSTTPLDTANPANLPAPLATVAAGIGTYDDTTAAADTTYYYAVAATKGTFVNPASAVQVDTAPPDVSTAQVGDAIGGGIYAGTITYADSRQFHIIVSKIDAEADAAFASNSGTNVPGCEDEYDGFANTQDIIAEGISAFPAANHCVNYVDAEGNNDYYLPAIKELEGPVQSLHSSGNFPTNSVFIWASNENPSTPDYVFQRRIIENGPTRDTYAINTAQVRPIRRVAV